MHPLVKILYLVLILLVISSASNTLLLSILLILTTVAFALHCRNFLRLLKRMRLLFLSILLIYGFGTPGEYLSQLPLAIAPTFEGLKLGSIQIIKICIALAALTILLNTTNKDQLIIGIYTLFKPFKYLGVNVERFSVRLSLTLDYFEEFAAQAKSNLNFKQIDDIHASLENEPLNDMIYMNNPALKLTDIVMILFAALSFVALCFLHLS